MVFQPLHKDALQKAAKDGGNCLGLDDEEESLFGSVPSAAPNVILLTT